MDPVAFELRGLSIRWYGIFVTTGILMGLFYVLWQGKKWSYDSEDIIDFLLFGLPITLIGTRLYYVVFNWRYYSNDLRRIIDITSGGLAIHGAIITGILYTFVFVRRRDFDFLEFADLLTPAFLLGLAVGRWGNFANQEAHGGEVSQEFMEIFPGFIREGMYIEGSYYHPAFFYEFIWNTFVFILLVIYTRSRFYSRGKVLALGLGLYSLGRFFIEDIRVDSLYLAGIQIARPVSGAILALCLVFFIRDRKGDTDEK
ncbi:prolipoprotein diacylglyceryl transferase [Halarsenatibacter silvermanii]|uniref:Phosphatidylglycerol--prolipoprotein diacylglyceryl transferase n=1 Tax=Halarsenatibacter silvermanii TaxID=321763 RepID=A0A1G9JJ62_9FIRM|nr:prolipoprotein diacylglyceryl transferase [Halarsenatibacter silvermanii]SDL37650.1 Prolipoprotein diacylglyceryl transferase [Halarsenatibacter silvermanii]